MIWHVQYRVDAVDYIAPYPNPERAIDAACLLIDHGCDVYGLGAGASADRMGRDEIDRIYVIWARAKAPF
jgi:hypothetical protein